MRKVLMGALLAAGVMLAQSPRAAGPTQYPWWNSRIANSLELSDAQTKKLNEIQQAYVGTLKDLNAAVTKAETNLNEIYNQVEIDDLKAGVAVDQYVNARDNLTRVLSQMSLKMRGVLTIEQWQQLENLQNGRAGRGGRGRGRGGAPSGSGPASGTTSNKVGPAISQSPVPK